MGRGLWAERRLSLCVSSQPPASPSTQEAIQGMLSMANLQASDSCLQTTWGAGQAKGSSLVAHGARKNGGGGKGAGKRLLKRAAKNSVDLDDYEEEQDHLDACFKDSDYGEALGVRAGASSAPGLLLMPGAGPSSGDRKVGLRSIWSPPRKSPSLARSPQCLSVCVRHVLGTDLPSRVLCRGCLTCWPLPATLGRLLASASQPPRTLLLGTLVQGCRVATFAVPLAWTWDGALLGWRSTAVLPSEDRPRYPLCGHTVACSQTC